MVHPTGVEIRVGIDHRTRQPVRQRPVLFPGGTQAAARLSRSGSAAAGDKLPMPEQYREGIRVSFGVSLGLLPSWLAARSRILTLFLWGRGGWPKAARFLTGSQEKAGQNGCCACGGGA